MGDLVAINGSASNMATGVAHADFTDKPMSPLIHLLLGPLLVHLGVGDEETVAYYSGAGGTLNSDVWGFFMAWVVFYIALTGFYFTFCPLSRW